MVPAMNRSLLVAALAFVSVGCQKSHTQDWPDRPGPKVVVSFAPLYSFVASVAGDDAVVKNVMTTTGPHDFNPTDQDARLLQKADLFFINGLDLDNAKAKTMKQGVENARLQIVDLGSKLDKSLLMEGVCQHMHKPGEAHQHGDDPHVWLSPSRAIKMVEAIREALKEADPSHAANYDRRAAEYITKLEKLQAEGLALLKDKKDRKLVTFHESMNYFADDYKLSVFDVVQQKPGTEPGTEDIQKLLRRCANADVSVIAVEPQYSRNESAKTLLDELKHKGVKDARFVSFDPLETVTPGDLTPDWYERKMRQNLQNLAEGLK